MKVPIVIQMSEWWATRNALLDSGATESFIHPRVVHELRLSTNWLHYPWTVQNVDGTNNKLGEVTDEVWLLIWHENYKEEHRFLVADIGEDDIILGYPFFEAANPLIDWPTRRMCGMITTTEVWPPIKGPSSWICQIMLTLKKTTIAQQLAEQASSKEEQTWEELVPEQYHKFGSIFLEVDSERFPRPRKWDHAIDLKPDAPTLIDCHIYPLSPKEKEEQKEFLAENLQLKCIWQSNSPYTSGFFLIRKKDRKFHPVQDYCNLNKWTVPNRYPLPLINDLIYDLAGYRLFSKFDIWWGYNNICIKKGDKWKATFKTSEGLFEPMVMFFGLTNSPVTFQTMMDDIFRDEIVQGWLKIYMDDLIVTSEEDETVHQQRVVTFYRRSKTTTSSWKPRNAPSTRSKWNTLASSLDKGRWRWIL
jgi:reverse transcriptase-like protein/aspartyl protease